jgi:hypothetical protein
LRGYFSFVFLFPDSEKVKEWQPDRVRRALFILNFICIVQQRYKKKEAVVSKAIEQADGAVGKDLRKSLSNE